MCKKLILGIYGGICTGKSLTCETLENLGCAVISADKLGHQAYKPGEECWEKVMKAFPGVAGPDLFIDRKKLGAEVFSDQSGNKLKQLNDIVWPAIAKLCRKRISEISLNNTNQAIALEAALLVDANWHTMCDRLWVFHITREVALDRLQNTRGLTYEESAARLGHQLSNDQRIELAAKNFPPSKTWVCDRSNTSVDEAVKLITDRYNKELESFLAV
eukprot:TRINITY_DN24328_c0_g1_i1.p1 TRINITY_DN24328_c0_g1~~TRINITY_DN24328_c0_g1_i1.p1  ORF type:complete len:217 (+),score=28.65 TRINITY_DN24328_c0_g1_i1:54-704(+)